MKINAINNLQSFCGREQFVKEFSTKLTDGSQAKIRINLNKTGNPRSMECYAFNKFGNIEEGKGLGRNPELKLTELIDFLNYIQKMTNDDILAKFTKVMPH